jgi:hypothetical protein
VWSYGLPGPEQEQRPVAERRGEVDDPLVHGKSIAELHVIWQECAAFGENPGTFGAGGSSVTAPEPRWF